MYRAMLCLRIQFVVFFILCSQERMSISELCVNLKTFSYLYGLHDTIDLYLSDEITVG
jgi:hypothetical protein